MVRALPAGSRPTQAFRDEASATLRLSRARGRSECDALGAAFEDEAISDDRRSLILDILASAGTPEAQIVMRRLLSLDVVRRNGRTFASFVQRLGFMERPDGATLGFLISVYAESKDQGPEVRFACAYALGAGAGRAHVWGLTEAATRASDVLRHDLRLAVDPSEKCALVTALGNAGLESDVTIILGLVDDPAPLVRGAATRALRRMHTREARAALLLLLTNADQNVAETALSVLFEQALEPQEIVRLAELVLAGRTPPALDSRVLRLIVTQKLGLSTSTAAIDESIHLLLSRIEAPSRRGSSGYSRRFGDSEAEELPRAKAALPYPAGYRFTGPPNPEPEPESELEPDTIDESKLAVHVEAPAESGEEVRSRSAYAVASPVKPRAVIR